MIFLQKSLDFMKEHRENSPDRPFFLLHCTQAVHLPSFASNKLKGKTEAGPHGDFIFQFDYVVGALMEGLKENGFSENTLVMVSSDNGPEVPTIHDMRERYKHDGARPWRGVKRDNWEGGHRVPMIAHWPGKIKAGSTTGQTVCLTDIMATCADLVGAELPDNAAEDSFSMLPVLLGKQEAGKPLREYTLHQTMSLKLSIRRGKWKYLDHRGSGGNNYQRSGVWGMKQYALPERAPDAPGQLYNLQEDPGERVNLYHEHPDIVEKLKTQLEAFKANGRSRP